MNATGAGTTPVLPTRFHAIYPSVASAARRLQGKLRRIARSITSLLPVSPDDLPRLAAQAWLRGRGIEIGALHHPMRLPRDARARYLDRMSLADLRRHYPTLAKKRFVNVDIVDDGERLDSIADASEDFIIANHFLEHCQDPIGTLKNMIRVLRPGGALYLTLPDKRGTFDRDRPVTPLSHLRIDHECGPDASRRGHYEEWVRAVEKLADEDQIQRRVDELMARDYSIHFHVWTFREMTEMFLALMDEIGFEIVAAVNRGKEATFLLRKCSDQ
jgi:SAM-dependent methyltransferase